jgi:uncharacterized membrane protein
MDHRPPHPHPQPRDNFFFGDGPHHGHDEWWNGPLHVLLLFLFIALVVVAAISLVRRLSPSVAQAAAPAAVAPGSAVATAGVPDPAVATLRMRYAKGEVSREDFQNALADLTGAETPTADWPTADAGDEPTPTPTP